MLYRDMTHPDILKVEKFGELHPSGENLCCEHCGERMESEEVYIGRYSGIFCSKQCHDSEWEIKEEYIND